MNKIQDTALAFATLALLTLAGVLLFSRQLMAQEPMVLRFGTTMSEARGTLDRLPYLSQKVDENQVTIQNTFLLANYNFVHGELERITITRNYDTEKIATAAMEGYLVYLGRVNATLVPVVRNGSHTVYYAMTNDAHYELELETRSRKESRFTVRIQSRISSVSDPEGFEVRYGMETKAVLVADQAFAR